MSRKMSLGWIFKVAFGGRHYNRSDPLNSTIVPFDILMYNLLLY